MLRALPAPRFCVTVCNAAQGASPCLMLQLITSRSFQNRARPNLLLTNKWILPKGWSAPIRWWYQVFHSLKPTETTYKTCWKGAKDWTSQTFPQEHTQKFSYLLKANIKYAKSISEKRYVEHVLLQFQQDLKYTLLLQYQQPIFFLAFLFFLLSASVV